MTSTRYNELDASGASPSAQEIHEGWHWCPEYDDLLMLIGEIGCRCAQWKPVAMANRMQALSRSSFLVEAAEF